MRSATSLQADDGHEAEIELLRDVLNGGEQAWSEFCHRYDNLIVGCVLRVLRRYSVSFTSADLADLVGEVWIALLRDDRRKLRLYDADRGYRLSSWLGLIATNCTIDQLRLRQVELSYLEDIAGSERLLVDFVRPDASYEMKEAAALARRAIEHLSDEERQFVISCYREERPPAELARELGVNINTVYSRKFKVRQKLARIFAALHPEESPEQALAA